MNKIGVFYGSTTGTTEDLARRIAEKLDVPSAHIMMYPNSLKLWSVNMMYWY